MTTTRVAAALTACALLYTLDPATTWWLPACPFHLLTGWLCPLCGSTRAVHELLHGAPLSALQMNPLTTLGALGGLGAFALDLLGRSERACLQRLAQLAFSPAGIAIVLAFGVLRNVVGSVGP